MRPRGGTTKGKEVNLSKIPSDAWNSDHEHFRKGIKWHEDLTETEAQIAANWLGCQGTHTHFIKGKKIWMPCTME